MRDETYALEPSATEAAPPFTCSYVPARRSAFWRIREGNGRAIGSAQTRAGARAGVRALYQSMQGAA